MTKNLTIAKLSLNKKLAKSNKKTKTKNAW